MPVTLPEYGHMILGEQMHMLHLHFQGVEMECRDASDEEAEPQDPQATVMTLKRK